MKFPGLKQVNPMETLKQSNQAAVGLVGMSFKEWVSNKTVFETTNIKERNCTPCLQRVNDSLFFS